MLTKKICLLGSFSVGKTSLVARFVQSIFSEEYLTTVGVKVDKKIMRSGDQELTLMIWDLAGDDDFQRMNVSFLRGSAGIIYVADGTRPASVDAVRDLRERVRTNLGELPSVLALNKADLADQWQIDEVELSHLRDDGWSLRKTSAKDGLNVEETFSELASRMLSK
jgi:small GTP-binding protein